MMRPQTTTLYDVLGLERDAPLNQIRAAFRKLAMQHHPDRFQGEKRARAEQRFQEITEAFNVLGRPDSREKYDREIARGGEGHTMDRAEIARRLASKGAQAFKEGRLAEALDDLKMAINHDDDCGRAHYFMGVTLARVGGREKDALRHVERALMLEPNNATIMAEAAQLALSVGLKSRARRFAEQAAALDPTNSKASEVLQQTGDDHDDSTGEGLFSRFRRKG